MQKPLTIKHFVVFKGSYVFLKQVTNYHPHLFSQCLAFSCASLPWSCPIFYIALSNVCIVMHNVCCVMHFYAARAKPAPEGEPCPVCVSTCPPLVCMPCGWMPCCLSSSPTTKERLQANLQCNKCLFAFAFFCACVFFLTLDVYLLHLIDLCDSLSKLLCKLPELLSARGAETYQLLLLWGKWAQHGDAMGIVWWETQTKCVKEKKELLLP